MTVTTYEIARCDNPHEFTERSYSSAVQNFSATLEIFRLFGTRNFIV